jgi:hypothetical protein
MPLRFRVIASCLELIVAHRTAKEKSSSISERRYPLERAGPRGPRAKATHVKMRTERRICKLAESLQPLRDCIGGDGENTALPLPVMRYSSRVGRFRRARAPHSNYQHEMGSPSSEYSADLFRPFLRNNSVYSACLWGCCSCET